MSGIIYPVAGWRPGIDPLDTRWGATCDGGEVFRGSTEDDVRDQLKRHRCGPPPEYLELLLSRGTW